jgi:hypothetical protein
VRARMKNKRRKTTHNGLSEEGTPHVRFRFENHPAFPSSTGRIGARTSDAAPLASDAEQRGSKPLSRASDTYGDPPIGRH